MLRIRLRRRSIERDVSEQSQDRLPQAEVADDQFRRDLRAVGELNAGGAFAVDGDPVNLARGHVGDAQLAPGRDERVGDRLAATDRDRGGLKGERQRDAVDQSLEPRDVVGEAAGRCCARAHEQDLQLRAFEEVLRELPERHELVDGLDQAVRDAEQLLERVGGSPRRRDAEPVPAECLLPVPLICVQQREVGVGIAFGEARNLLPCALNVLLGAFLATGPCVNDA